MSTRSAVMDYVHVGMFFLARIAMTSCRTLFPMAVALLLAVVAGRPAASAEPVSRPVDTEGFTSLFDGRTLDGWEGDKTLWKVVDGMIVGDSAGIPKNQFLATTRQFGDFELRLEFRLKDGKGNTGVQFRSERDPKSTEVSGYQADIGENYWGCLYDEHRRNKILAQAVPELKSALKPSDWNSYVIRAEGPRIQLAMNGVTSVNYVEADDKIARRGMIALQVHSGPPLKVEFRNIRIKVLGETK